MAGPQVGDIRFDCATNTYELYDGRRWCVANEVIPNTAQTGLLYMGGGGMANIHPANAYAQQMLYPPAPTPNSRTEQEPDTRLLLLK